MKIKEAILKYAPVFLQNIAITIYNRHLYQTRHKGLYKKFTEYHKSAKNLSKEEALKESESRLKDFLEHATSNSPWYSTHKGKKLEEFPILEKIDLLENLEKISTTHEDSAIISLTGGTTGASMKVLYRQSDIQERFAILDSFRSEHGYQLGKKTAWFSGKGLIREKDLNSGKCYRDDYVNKIRFFSTFHITKENFESYWKAFTEFSPEYIVGFPSSVYDLCCMAIELNLEFKGKVKVFFPTAETVLRAHREVIGRVLGCKLVDQYASSEGAPFILQCTHGSLHIHPLTGVFEVVDENMNHTNEGELLVTSFTTYGTPLIRYRIGDRIKLASKDFSCPCGSYFPVVEYIDGRSSDFIWSHENGRVNLGNISNCTKDVKGIQCFQLTQDAEDEVLVKVVATSDFNLSQEIAFKEALHQRLGQSMKIKISRTDEIPREKSGKFRIVKNSLSSTKLAKSATSSSTKTSTPA